MDHLLFFLAAMEFVLAVGTAFAFTTLYRGAPAKPLGFALSFSLMAVGLSFLGLVADFGALRLGLLIVTAACMAVQGVLLTAAIRRITRPALFGHSQRMTEVVRRFHLNRDDQALLELIGDAQTNKAIAESLNLSEETVKRQVSRMLRKTGTQSRTQLMALVPAGS